MISGLGIAAARIRRVLSVAALCATWLTVSSAAFAGVFDGFAADDSGYRTRLGQVCTPVTLGSSAKPRCTQLGQSPLRFTPGHRQSGPDAKFRARAQGTTIAIEGAAAKLGDHESSDPVDRIVAVYLSDAGGLLAIEYQVRAFGRVRDRVLVVRVPSLSSQSAPTTSKKPATAMPGVRAPESVAGDRPELVAALRKARIEAKRTKPRPRAFHDVLAIDPQHPYALYHLARAWAGRKKWDQALETLAKLGRSAQVDTAIWVVEARFERQFAKLRGRREFRAAVWLDPPPGHQPSAYERAVGHGGRWEQPGQRCERARINLNLTRQPAQFRLLIRSTCQGDTETTRLAGTWSAKGRHQLVLTLPNQGREAERFVCGIRACTDGDDESCISCSLGEGLDLHLRPVLR